MLYSCFSTAAAEAAGVPGKSHDQGSSEEDQQGAEPGPVWEAEGGKCSSYRPLETTGKAGQLGSQYRVVPTLKDHGIDHKNVFSENRWSLRTGQLYWNVGYFARNMWDCSTQRQVVSQGSGLARGSIVLWNYFPVSMQVGVPLLVPSSHLVQSPCVINLLYVVNKNSLTARMNTVDYLSWDTQCPYKDGLSRQTVSGGRFICIEMQVLYTSPEIPRIWSFKTGGVS